MGLTCVRHLRDYASEHPFITIPTKEEALKPPSSMNNLGSGLGNQKMGSDEN